MPKYIITLLFFVFVLKGSSKFINTSFSQKSPQIDGQIGKKEWANNDSATGFVQLEPFKGKPASEITIVYSQFDDENLYFAFKCLNNIENNIIADIQIRDQLRKKDDAVFVVLDPYLDKRSGFVFQVNPLGTQTDLRIADDGRRSDSNWDVQWSAASQITEYGWSAEIAIPFTSLAYDDTLKNWGINFGRIIRHNSETAYWSGTLNDDFRISQNGILSGIRTPTEKLQFTLTPFSTLRFEDSDQTGNYNKWIAELGFDATYQITSSLKANMTINPDFATVEGDQERINLSRFELRFPEKRLFFLEGNELFSTRIKTFYSRRIGDIDYGGKVTGKIKDYTVSLIHVNSNDDSTNGKYSVFRMKKDILESSTVGLTIVDKTRASGFSRSLSADYVLNLGESWKITGQFVGSAPGNFWPNSAYFFRIARENNYYHYHLRYSDIGRNFEDNVNQTGFVYEEDRQVLDSDISYKWWFDNSIVKYLSLETLNNVYWNHDGDLKSWFVTEHARLYFQNCISVDLAYNDEFKLDENKFYNHKYKIFLGYNTDEWASAKIKYIWGKNYNRNFLLFVAEAHYQPIESLSLEYSFNKLDYSPDPDLDGTNINILSADYYFTRDLWIRLFAQSNSTNDRVYLYGMFGWRFQPPFGALYLIYTSNKQNNIETFTEETDLILFLKFSYQLGL